jgi:UPF0755 protein
MKSFLTTLIIVPIIAVIWFVIAIDPVSNSSKKQEFTIATGQDIDLIGENLKVAGLIRSPFAFKIVVYLNKLPSKIQAGYFSLSPSDSTQDIAKSLTKAQSKQVFITIPEGLRRQEVANIIIDKLQASKLKHSFNPDLFISQTAALEGQLFPDTYAFPENVDTQKAIDLLHGKFLQVASDLKIDSKDLLRITTLASLVEKEAGQDSERAEIAGVITNRLAENWPIQIDASIQYFISNNRCRIRICDWWPKNLTKDDLAIPSPYNTYKNQGLPPTPIANPGKNSLAAAKTPKTTQAWFYLHGLDGVIRFANTIEQHNKNICLYLKKSCN